MRTYFISLIFLLLSGSTLLGQQLPSHYTFSDWETIKGFRGTVAPERICHNFFTLLSQANIAPPAVSSSGAYEIYNHIQAALNYITPPANSVVIQELYFPPGVYNLHSATHINYNNIVIKGAGSNQTEFVWPGLLGAAFEANGTTGIANVPTYSFIGNPAFWDPLSASGLTVGDWAMLEGKPREAICWPEDERVRQIVQVGAIDANTPNKYYATSNFRADFQSNVESPKFTILNPLENIGFECFKIRSITQPNQIYYGSETHIEMNIVVNSWIKGVESKDAITDHVYLSQSSNIEIDGCYFNGISTAANANYRDQDGILLGRGTGECEIVNNIFRKLDHAVELKGGANGNVIAYNYSRETKPTGDGAREDIFFGGDWPFANLVEGNVIEEVKFSKDNGWNGPFNVMFRNDIYAKAIKSSSTRCSKTHQVAAVGNVTSGCIRLSGSNSQVYDNDQNGFLCNGSYGLNTNNAPIGDSYAYASRPDWFPVSQGSWPPIGPNSGPNNNIPAFLRWSTTSKTVGNNCNGCGPTPIIVSYTVTPCQRDIIGHVFPGNIQLSISGGTPPFSTSWAPPANLSGTSTYSATFHQPGTYTATVTDAGNNPAVVVTIATGPCEDEMFKTAVTPADFEAQLFPNPAQRAATLRLVLPESDQLSVELYALNGQRVSHPQAGQSLTAGTHALEIPVAHLPNGIYFCRIKGERFNKTMRLLVQK